MTEPNLVQYIFVPKKPKMSPGKIASQVAHATFLALEKFRNCRANEGCTILEWKENGMCVIVLQVKNQIELHNVSKKNNICDFILNILLDKSISST